MTRGNFSRSNNAVIPVAVRHIEFYETKARIAFELLESRLFQGDVVVLVEIVQPNDLIAAIEQRARSVIADEPRRTSDQNLHVLQPSVDFVRTEHILDVVEDVIALGERSDLRKSHVAKLLVRNCHDDRIVA